MTVTVQCQRMGQWASFRTRVLFDILNTESDLLDVLSSKLYLVLRVRGSTGMMR